MTPPRAVVLDMEGVLHVDWQAIAGSAAAVERLTGAGVGLAVLTNTTGRTRADIAGRLGAMGMPIPAGRIVTAASAAAEHLRRHHPGARVHALVEPAIAVELEGGVRLVDDPAAAEVILLGGPDERWTYSRLNAIFRRLVDGVPLVAMQRNRWWPTVDGPSLDAGGFVGGPRVRDRDRGGGRGQARLGHLRGGVRARRCAAGRDGDGWRRPRV